MVTRRRLWCGIWSLSLLLAFGAPATADPQAKNVLILHSYERESTTQSVFAGIFRSELGGLYSGPINFMEVSLQQALLREDPREEPALKYLQSILAGQPIDLVLALGGPAATFAQRYGRDLFPSTPLLFSSVDRRFLQTSTFSANQTAVAVSNEPPKVIENILHVLPETRTIYVVIGTSQLEHFWHGEMEKEFQKFKGRVTFEWLNNLSFAEMMDRAAALPPRSAIFFVVLTKDARGVSHLENHALSQLRSVTSAPIFGLHSTQLGHGIVGGPLMPIEEVSRSAGRVALRILNGESPGAIKTPPYDLSPPTYDAHELRRWDISESRLPPGSIVLFREPTLWERYKWPIVAGVSFSVAQALLVIALLVNLVKRRRTERSLKESEERFRLLSNSAPVMVWMSGPDKLRTDFNRGWLAFTGRTIEQELGTGWAEGVHPEDLDRYLDTYNRSFDRRESFRMEYRLRRDDGEYRWILDTGVPRLAPDHSCIGYIGSCLDVTDLRLAKAALSNFSQRLMEAQEQERAWIARELHDDLGQRMVSLTVQLDRLWQEDASDRPARISDLGRELTELAKDTQAISHRLHSSKLEYLGLATAAKSFCRELSAQRGVLIEFTHEDLPSDLPHDIALGLFRVLQEALNNAVKHSRAQHFEVWLQGEGDAVQLEVADDGVGFDSEAAMDGHGLGLISMRERISLIRGEFFIESHPDSGTTIRARVRVRRNSPPAGTDATTTIGQESE